MLQTRLRSLISRHASHRTISSRFYGRMASSKMDHETMEDYTTKALTYEMEVYQRKAAERTVPWFLANMPQAYFTEIDRDLQKDHLRALTALTEAGLAHYEEDEAQKLCEAAAKGDMSKIKQLINMGAHPNTGDYDGRTPLHLAAAEGKMQVLKYLMTVKGANINVVDRFGGTPLEDAERHEEMAAVKWIKSMGGLKNIVAQEESVDDRAPPEPKKTGAQGMVELMLKSRNGNVITFFKPHQADSVGDFVSVMNQIPLETELSRIKGFVTKDMSMLANIFDMGQPDYALEMDQDDFDELTARFHEAAKEVKEGTFVCDLGDKYEWSEQLERDSLNEYLRNSPIQYLENTPPERLFNHMKLWRKTIGTDYGACSVVVATDTEDEGDYWVNACISNVHIHSEVQRFSKYMANLGYRVDRIHLDRIKDPHDGDKAMVRALVTPIGGAKMDIEKLKVEVPRLKFLDDEVTKWVGKADISYTEAEVCTSLGNMIFSVVNKEHPYAYTLDRVMRILQFEEHQSIAKETAQLFLAKFNPDKPLTAPEVAQKADDIRKNIEANVQGNIQQHLLLKMVTAVEKSLRTNVYLPHRMSLTIRIDPTLLLHEHPAEPYGVFFCHSRRMNGFHVRFRDIARGGLRVVPTDGVERFGQEAMRHFDEVYGLAFAQQLKNKDIPEGGSKCVVLVNTNDRMPGSRDWLIRKSVRCFTDGLLDLISPEPETKSNIVDLWGKDELLYLGPDENIIPEDIVWVTEQAAKRHMKYPRAFMSSKPDAGINHKVYGVTSEGVAVFLKVALQNKGFDTDKDDFTIKMTGGPNGDVAGNMIKIMRRDYHGRGKFVGIVDHTGGVEDPKGLDLEELYRLHIEDLPIGEYNRSKLSSTGKYYGCETTEDVQLRNTMHNRIEADAFIPAGGRPNTININNWNKFFKEDGSPTSSLIVEAANIFTTPEARKELGKRGVMIVKDSSANKAGVMCSSYEIVASMILSGKDEFMSIKEELVEGVLELLREKARVEAELLFREYRNNPDTQLPAYSQKISDCINRASDAVIKLLTEDFEKLDPEARRKLMVEGLPKKLVDVANDRLDSLPQAYIVSMMGAALGSKMVYNEGLQYIDSLAEASLADFATRYVYEEEKVKNYLTELEGSDIAHKDDIMRILRSSGVRSVLAAGL